MSIQRQLDLGGITSMRLAVKNTALTAGGAGDATTVTGQTLDRAGFAGPGEMPLTAVFTALLAATLASGNTLSAGLVLQDSADSTNWSNVTSIASTVYLTGASGGGAIYGQATLATSLRSTRRYVRFNITPDLSAAGTDTAAVMGHAAFAGFDEVPAPA